MMKIFIFLMSAFALPSIIKLKSGNRELTILSSAIQDLHYFVAYADFLKHQKNYYINEFEIYSECYDAMPYLIALLAEFKHGKTLQSQFTDYTRLTYCASFYGASNQFLEALQSAQSNTFIRLYVTKSNDIWKTSVGSPDIFRYHWRDVEIIAFNAGYVKEEYGQDYMIFKKLRE